MFREIEAARAWLAWLVVASHIIYLCELKFPGHSTVVLSGQWAVLSFVIISGFVITHLIITKREDYMTYITRRALRIFPVYLVCLAASFAVMPLAMQALSHPIYGPPTWLSQLTAQRYEMQTQLAAHLIAHLSLLHGAIPNSVLDQSSIMFLGPAWSLSLEWQFYLLAPLIVSASLNERGRWWMLGGGAVAAWLYNRGTFGFFGQPSIIFGAALLFMVGILTRIYLEALPKLERFPFETVLAAFLLCLAYRDLVPIAVWFIVVAFMLVQDRLKPPLLRAALHSKVMVAAGQRSYSVYLLHWPVILLAGHIAKRLLQLPQPFDTGFVAAFTVLTTFAGAELLHRYVERPVHAFGKKFSNRRERGAEDVRSAR